MGSFSRARARCAVSVGALARPTSRNNYFVDDPAGNIACVGAWKSGIAGIAELVALYRSKQAPTTCMLTASMPIQPSLVTTTAGLTEIESTIIKPLVVLRDSSQVVMTDFTAPVATWRQSFNGRACTYQFGVVTH